jgi:hypothetical protein
MPVMNVELLKLGLRIRASRKILGLNQNRQLVFLTPIDSRLNDFLNEIHQRFDLDTAIAYAKALSQYDLFWYEEPGDPLDFELQATLRNYYKNPMATGEDLFSVQDARNLIRYGGMRPDRDYLQFDCALSYGLVEYLRTLEMLKEHGWSPLPASCRYSGLRRRTSRSLIVFLGRSF